MTDQQPESDVPENIRASLTLIPEPEEGEPRHVSARVLAIGAHPLIIIEPEADGNDLVFNIMAFPFDSAHDFADVLSMLAETLNASLAEGQGGGEA